MPVNSRFGQNAIVKAILAHPRAPSVASRIERCLFLRFGALLIRLLGYPLELDARIVTKSIIAAFRNVPGTTLLDAGSGIGIHAFGLAALGWEVVAIDLSRDSLGVGSAIQRSLGEKLTFVVGNLERPGLKDSVFDAVVMSHVLEHIEDDKKALKTMRGLLKPGGCCCLSCPTALGHRRSMMNQRCQGKRGN